MSKEISQERKGMRLFSHFTNIISCWQLSLFLHLVSSTGIPSLSWLLNTLKIQKVLPPAMWLTLFETDIKAVTNGTKWPHKLSYDDKISNFSILISLQPKIVQLYLSLLVKSFKSTLNVVSVQKCLTHIGFSLGMLSWRKYKWSMVKLNMNVKR